MRGEPATSPPKGQAVEDVHYQRGYRQGFDRGTLETQQKIMRLAKKLESEASLARSAADDSEFDESERFAEEASVLERVVRQLLAE